MREQGRGGVSAGPLVAVGLVVTLGGWTSPGAIEEPHSKVFALPPGKYKPAYIAVCASGDAIVFSHPTDAYYKTQLVYVFRLSTGELKDVYRGGINSIIAAPVPHIFILEVARGDPPHVLLLQDDGKLRNRVDHPIAYAQWSRDGKYIVFPTDRPDVTEDSPDFNPNGFTAVGILDVETLRLRWFPVRLPAYSVHLALFDNRIYVSDRPAGYGEDPRVTVYDLTGKMLGVAEGLRGNYFSASGRYYVPPLHEALSFSIFERSTNRPMRSFPGLEEQKGEYYVYRQWNPIYDDLIVLERRLLSKNGMREQTQLEVYSVSQDKPLRTFPESPWAWAPAGKALVIFRSGKFIFEPIEP